MGCCGFRLFLGTCSRRVFGVAIGIVRVLKDGEYGIAVCRGARDRRRNTIVVQRARSGLRWCAAIEYLHELGNDVALHIMISMQRVH